jgi:hypothetical protein
MSNKFETIRVGVMGEKPLTDKGTLGEARSRFFELYQCEPTQLRVSPKAFNDLRAFAERYEYPFGFEVKVDDDFDTEQWCVCNEETKVFAI